MSDAASDGLTFRLPRPTPLLNEMLRQHWRVRRRANARIAGLVRLATQGQRPAVPFERALVRIERRSLRVPDTDNLWGGVKGLLDCLLPPGDPVRSGGRWVVLHPSGLSIVRDDTPDCLVLDVVAVQVRRVAEQCTVVRITPLPVSVPGGQLG
ncbi:MAG TPA: hypothetical protein VGC15_14050 [Acetobacteraceae bacterium]